MSFGVWVLIVAIAVATLFGLWRAASDGRLRGTHRVGGLDTAGGLGGLDTPGGLGGLDTPGSAGHSTTGPWSDQLGERATLVQFSSAFCAPCRTTRQVLGAVAEAVPGVNHIEIDAEHHLDLVRELGIMRTPTTLILDATGAERFRASGVPKRDQVIAAL